MATLTDYEIDPDRGYLPKDDPLTALPKEYTAWDQAGADLPKLLLSDHVRKLLDEIPEISIDNLTTRPQLERAMVLLSFIGHGYVWGEKDAAETLPRNLAVPWAGIAEKLGRPPVLSYASYASHNWRRLEPKRAIEVGNIGLLQNFWGGVDEEWFILIHVAIEQAAAPAVNGCFNLKAALEEGDPTKLLDPLRAINESMKNCYADLERMTEFCDPYCYYERVRPFIHGWKNHPVLTEGLIYEGVEHFDGKPQQFRGETGAQSSIIPALDGILKIFHEDDPLRQYLIEMKYYMPPSHRTFIDDMEAAPCLREAVTDNSKDHPELKDGYNEAVTWVEKFRTLHLEYADKYIFRQSQSSANNPSKVGTGGTPFMKYLAKHRDETSKHLLT